MAHAQITCPKCKTSFYFTTYNNIKCPSCDYVFSISAPPAKPEEPKNVPDGMIPVLFWLYDTPDRFDYKQKYVIEIENYIALIEPPYYKSYMLLKKGTPYNMTIQTTYKNKTVHSRTEKLDTPNDNAKCLDVRLETREYPIRKILLQRMVNNLFISEVCPRE